MNRSLNPLLVAVCMAPMIAHAADVYVRPGAAGRNDGSDWTNAYTKLPSTLIRGNTYWLADGDYGSYVFNTPNSGTATITLKKAIPGANGTNVGWSSNYGDNQATFTHWQIITDYYVFDGAWRPADWDKGNLFRYGIKVAGRGPVRLDDGNGTGGDNLTFRYVDFQGGGRDTGYGDDVIYGLTGNSNLTFQYCALHDSDRTLFLTRNNWKNLVVDHSYLARNTSTPANHGELMSVYSSTNMTFSNNIIEDIEGTAVWAGIGNGASVGWRIYGNVIFHSDAYRADTGRRPDHNYGIAGVIFVAYDASNSNSGSNIQFYQNTMANIVGSYSGVVIQRGTGNEVRNNLWYNSVRTNNSFTGILSNTWYYNTQADGDSTTTKTVCSGNCSVFVSIANEDFHLRIGTGGGLPLDSPFNVDMDGVTRGGGLPWDRGAYQYSPP